MKPIFDIGLYRCDSKRFRDELHEAINAAKKDLLVRSLGITEDQAPTAYGALESQVANEYGDWPYNQTIGWVRVWAVPSASEIWGELFYVNKKRIDRLLKSKRFRWYGEVFSIHIGATETSSSIAERLMAALAGLSSQRPFRGRFLDLESFGNISPFVNWKRLVSGERIPPETPADRRDVP